MSMDIPAREKRLEARVAELEGIAQELDRVAILYKESQARVAELEAMLKECADDLTIEIEARYGLTKNYPDIQRRYKQDMDTVVRARAVLAKGPSTSPELLSKGQDEGAA